MPRPDAFPGAMPANVQSDPLAAIPLRTWRRRPSGAFVLVMTHSHALDLAIVGARAGDEPRSPMSG